MPSTRLVAAAGLEPAFVLAAMNSAQDRPVPPTFEVRVHYTKCEFRIPVRDGKRLFTSVYVPKDTSHAYPFLMTRTPYTGGPYGEDNYRNRLGPSESFDRTGLITRTRRGQAGVIGALLLSIVRLVAINLEFISTLGKHVLGSF